MKHIHHELMPTQDEDEEFSNITPSSLALPINVVEAAIKDVVSRNNYGLDGLCGGKAPAAVCVWRWEVKDEYRDWLPKNAREKADSRQAERAQVRKVHRIIGKEAQNYLQAKKDLLALFEAMSQDDRDAILDPKGTAKLPTKELNKPESAESSLIDLTSEESKATTPSKKRKADEENNAVSHYYFVLALDCINTSYVAI